MYGRRRYYRKRRKFRPKRYFKRRYGLKSLNAKINKVERNLRPELKWHDTTVAVHPNTGETVSGLTAISQGDTSSNRDGNKVQAKSIQLKYQIDATAISIANTINVRMVLVQAMYNNIVEADPTWTQIYESASLYALREIANVKPQRFKVLWEKTVTVTNDPDANVSNVKYGSYYKKLNHAITYDGTGTIPQRGGLWLLCLAPEMAAATNLNVNVEARLRYTDS